MASQTQHRQRSHPYGRQSGPHAVQGRHHGSDMTTKHNYRVEQPQRVTREFCRQVMLDTIRQSTTVTDETAFASLSSDFLDQQLPPLSQEMCPKFDTRPIRFISDDTFTCIRQLMDANPTYRHRTAVLNMASDTVLAGSKDLPTGFSQEGALCMSSTLYRTLLPHKAKYPWRQSMSQDENNNCAAVYSPRVAIFKDNAKKQYRDLSLDQRKVVGVISVAAPRCPVGTQHSLLPPQKLYELREKIRMILRIAANDKKTVLVLGAMGCGEYHCPPGQVAAQMRNVLTQEEEFRGWFQDVVFAIYDKQICAIFKEEFERNSMVGTI